MHHVPQHHQQEVAVDIPLMELVHNDMGHAPQPRLHLAEEDPHCAEEDGAVWPW